MTPELHCGDCLDVLDTLAEASVDSVVTDPPYHLTSIVKRFGAENAKASISSTQRRFAKTGAAMSLGADGQPTPDQYGRLSKGFMGKQWDGGDIAFQPELWAKTLRVLKPGAHLLAFGGTRTYHRMACAIEDAGFEIRDCVMWVYGSGFPKSHNIGKAIDRAARAEREIIGQDTKARSTSGNSALPTVGGDTVYRTWDLTLPATDAARQWEGWGTALKPAVEPIVLARKPLTEKSVAANVLAHGTGALNIDGCRVAGVKPQVTQGVNSNATSFNVAKERRISGDPNEGRWPANVIHDGSPEVVEAFPESESTRSIITSKPGDVYGGGKGLPSHTGEYGFNDSGSAARFFYTAKADSYDRIGSKHPTVKPVDLMQYLVRLVTPKGGLVLDPFAGTGTTGEAAFREGMRSILIEKEPEYQECIRRRLRLLMAGPDEKQREIIKHKLGSKPLDAGPLFEFPEYQARDDFAKSIDACYEAVKERIAAGGEPWVPK